MCSRNDKEVSAAAGLWVREGGRTRSRRGYRGQVRAGGAFQVRVKTVDAILNVMGIQ